MMRLEALRYRTTQALGNRHSATVSVKIRGQRPRKTYYSDGDSGSIGEDEGRLFKLAPPAPVFCKPYP